MSTRIPFSKLSGSGNDFILIDNRDGIMNGIDLQKFIVNTCRRSVSIGADGVILIENTDTPGADFKWQFYNSDGSSAEMCGNGSRCAARFAYLNGIAGKSMAFETIAGIIKAEIKSEPDVKVQLTDPFDLKMDYCINLDGENLHLSSINTGVPHAVVKVDDIENFDIRKYGAAIRYHDTYKPKGTNVNFFAVNGDGSLRVRTYERGVENETMACGTGSVAVSIIAKELGLTESPATVITTSGIVLKVYMQDDGVFLEGEARLVYSGELTEESFDY